MEISGQKGLVNSKWSITSHAGYKSTSSTAEISAPPITSCKEIRFKGFVRPGRRNRNSQVMVKDQCLHLWVHSSRGTPWIHGGGTVQAQWQPKACAKQMWQSVNPALSMWMYLLTLIFSWTREILPLTCIHVLKALSTYDLSGKGTCTAQSQGEYHSKLPSYKTFLSLNPTSNFILSVGLSLPCFAQMGRCCLLSETSTQSRITGSGGNKRRPVGCGVCRDPCERSMLLGTDTSRRNLLLKPLKCGL